MKWENSITKKPMESKQTAIEWLVDKLSNIKAEDFNSTLEVRLIIQQAKEMEKQQERMYSEAIEFAEWIRIKDFQTASKDNWIGLDMKYYTTEELFEQFNKK